MTKCNQGCDCNLIHEQEVSKVKEAMLDDDTLISISDFYKALADSTRLKIINALDEGELCVCDISNILNMTKSAVSHQLKNLREMNLINCKKVGKEVFYSLADKHVKQVFEISKEHIMEMIDETNC